MYIKGWDGWKMNKTSHFNGMGDYLMVKLIYIWGNGAAKG